MAWCARHDPGGPTIPMTLNPEHKAWMQKVDQELSFAAKQEMRSQGIVPNYVTRGFHSGYPFPIPDFEFGVRIETKPRRLPMFLPLGFAYAIPQQIIDLIEAIEPGVHRYWPTDMTWEDGTAVAEKRWILNVCNRLDTLLPEVSQDMWVTKPPVGEGDYVITARFFGLEKTDLAQRRANPPSLFGSKDRIDGHAIWLEYRLGSGNIYFSDPFVAALLPLGISGIELTYYLREI